MNSFNEFIDRSKKLCQAWEVTLLMMTKLPSSSSSKPSSITYNNTMEFNVRVRRGMKSIFNATVYEGVIPSTNYFKNTSKV